MPVIDIHHPHSLGKPACRDAIDIVARERSARFGLCDMVWSRDTITFAGHGVEGNLTVGEADARLQVRLGPLLGLMRPVVEAEIRWRLREHPG